MQFLAGKLLRTSPLNVLVLNKELQTSLTKERGNVLFKFIFMHLADAFIQSDLQCSTFRLYSFQYVCSLGIEPTTFALLTQCSTTEPQEHWNKWCNMYHFFCFFTMNKITFWHWFKQILNKFEQKLNTGVFFIYYYLFKRTMSLGIKSHWSQFIHLIH